MHPTERLRASPSLGSRGAGERSVPILLLTDQTAEFAASDLGPARRDGHADLVGAQHQYLAGR